MRTSSLRTSISLAVALTLAACGGGGGGSSGGTPPAGAAPPPAVNSAPTISSLSPSQSVLQDSSSEPVTFGVADAESTASGVTVTVASSNPEVIPSEAVQIAGNDASRALLLTPMDGVAGTTTITITATDSAGLSTQQSMDVAVTSQQRSFREMVGTAFAKGEDTEAEETVGFGWVDNPEDDDTAFDDLLAN